MSRTEPESIADALDHLETLRRHIERADLDDETVADAVSLRLSAAIESLSQLSIATRDRVSGGHWNAMWSTRNRIAHGYAHIDLAIIRATVERDVPTLEADLRTELQAQADGRTDLG